MCHFLWNRCGAHFSICISSEFICCEFDYSKIDRNHTTTQHLYTDNMECNQLRLKGLHLDSIVLSSRSIWVLLNLVNWLFSSDWKCWNWTIDVFIRTHKRFYNMILSSEHLNADRNVEIYIWIHERDAFMHKAYRNVRSKWNATKKRKKWWWWDEKQFEYYSIFHLNERKLQFNAVIWAPEYNVVAF